MPTIEISDDAFVYLQSRAKAFIDTPATVLDRIIDEVRPGHPTRASGSMEMRFGVSDLPSVTATTITHAVVASQPARQKYWNIILEDMISACVVGGHSASEVRQTLSANIADGERSDNGYRFVPKAGFSFQGIDGNRACRNIAKLAEAFDVPVEISFRWLDNDKAQFPNRVARLVMP